MSEYGCDSGRVIEKWKRTNPRDSLPACPFNGSQIMASTPQLSLGHYRDFDFLKAYRSSTSLVETRIAMDTEMFIKTMLLQIFGDNEEAYNNFMSQVTENSPVCMLCSMLIAGDEGKGVAYRSHGDPSAAWPAGPRRRYGRYNIPANTTNQLE